eukprot:Skav208251  [mRNA]  locus=scaffold562:65869:70672:+ [translate_table: standard]
MFMRVFTVWVAALSLVTATSPCGDACDSETSELLQVTRKAEQESVHDDAGDLLKFRVVPVNEDRDFFSKIRPKKIALAMTGGGGGTTAGATGQFRALNSMGLLEKVDEATASGGAGIAAVILAYAKGHTVEELLGEETFGALSSLDRAEIKTPNGKILERVSTLSDPYVAVAANPFFGLSPEKLEEVVLAGRFLCPFGLNGKIPAFNAFKVGPFAEFDLCGNNNKNQVFTSSALAENPLCCYGLLWHVGWFLHIAKPRSEEAGLDSEAKPRPGCVRRFIAERQFEKRRSHCNVTFSRGLRCQHQ